MAEWILTVAGIAIVVIICDIILPDGQTKKYIKTVLGVVVTFVVVQSLVSLFDKGLDLNLGGSDIQSQTGYIESAANRRNEAKISEFRSTLAAERITAVSDVSVDPDGKKITLVISDKYSDETMSKLDEAVKKVFGNYKLSVIWK